MANISVVDFSSISYYMLWESVDEYFKQNIIYGVPYIYDFTFDFI